MAGWIKIHRDIASHWIFQDSEKFKWWIDMLFLASYEDNKVLVGNRIAEVKRGQFQGSLSFFMKRWRVSKDRVINFLRLLQAEGMILKETDRNIPLITICNYESYQDVPDNLPYYLPDNLPDNLPDTTKEVKEVKEINNTNNRAHAREENVSWIESVERSFAERFKAQGCAMQMAKVTGKNAKEIMTLLDVYMALRQLTDRGHKDFNQFVSLFKWHIVNNKVSTPAEVAQPQKTITNEDTYRLMKQMGWQDS